MNIWLIMSIAGLFTFGTRLSFILLLHRISVPAAVQRALRLVPVAVLSAIIVPALVLQDTHLALTPGNARLIAGIIAIIVAWRTKNAILTIMIGMGTLWALQAILPALGR